MDQHNKNTDTRPDMNNLTIKEALAMDAAGIAVRSKICVDPYMPFVPLTPIVVGKKVIKGVQSIFGILK